MNNNKAIKFAGILMIIVGFGMVVAAVYFFAYNTWFWISAESAEGEVVGWEDMETRPGPIPVGEKRAKSSLVLFENSAGEEIFFSTDVGSEPGLHSKGEKVIVLYNDQDPQKAMIRDFKSMYLGPLLLLPFGAVFGFIGVLVKAFAEGPPPKKGGRQKR